ncbi:hypothetical protein U8Q06_10015 [Rhizobium beringeri]|uniref:hypothetical protein n=1 Tax=Rhizobium beringeri TaxID=3019934 RepID=UPI002DDDAE62|nr:hypothetical protein [Rhizobium beringeri]WSG90738.1 hypothetical protein U8P73_09895 [Rhizobium beringeri]WSH52912.1 hypothetical protein U8Q06_10015 [Rhizobium beringeri]
MQISYADWNIKGRCLVLEDAENAYGRTNAQRLTAMIAEAEAFENAKDWHEFLGEDLVLAETMSFHVAFSSVYTATFLAIDLYQDVDQAGQVDWATVQYVKLTAISGQE